MNILYGVSGEGLGHASRALEVADFLEKRGHRVLIVTYGQAYNVFRKKFRTLKVYGIHLHYDNGKLRYRKSIWDNFPYFIKNFNIRNKIKGIVDKFCPDICMTDMEPIVPLISYLYHLPLISLSNQDRLTNFKINIPSKYKKDYLIAKAAIKLVVPKADYHIALSLSKLKTSNKNSYIVSPIIRREIMNKRKEKEKGKIVVYLSRIDKHVIDILRKREENFVIYGFDAAKKEGNLEFKTKEKFAKDFAECKAIISTAGFTSVGEAVYLKKPYLALPLGGQFEQMFNSLEIKRLGIGDYSEKLAEKELEGFLSKIPQYKKNLKKINIDNREVFSVLGQVLKKIGKSVSYNS